MGPVTAPLRRPLLVAVLVLGFAVTLVAGLLVGASLGDEPGEASPEEGSVDVGFSRDMREHHAQAVEMSVLVREATQDAEIRVLALDILLSQQQQAGQMFGWLTAWGVPQASSGAPMQWMGSSSGADGMDHDDMSASDGVAMPGMATPEELDRLARAEGRRAERLYLQLMIPHHQGGVAMAEEAASRAQEPQVRRLAQSIVDSQTAEIEVLRSMLAARGGALDAS